MLRGKHSPRTRRLARRRWKITYTGETKRKGQISGIRSEHEEEEKRRLSSVVPIKNAANLSSPNVGPNERDSLAVMQIKTPPD